MCAHTQVEVIWLWRGETSHGNHVRRQFAYEVWLVLNIPTCVCRCCDRRIASNKFDYVTMIELLRMCKYYYLWLQRVNNVYVIDYWSRPVSRMARKINLTKLRLNLSSNGQCALCEESNRHDVCLVSVPFSQTACGTIGCSILVISPTSFELMRQQGYLTSIRDQLQSTSCLCAKSISKVFFSRSGVPEEFRRGASLHSNRLGFSRNETINCCGTHLDYFITARSTCSVCIERKTPSVEMSSHQHV